MSVSRFKFSSGTYCQDNLFNFDALVFSPGTWDDYSLCKIVTRFRNNVSETCDIVFITVFHVSGKKTVLTLTLKIFDGENICYTKLEFCVPHICSLG